MNIDGIPAYHSVVAERCRQDARWGGRPGSDRVHPDGYYLAVLGEEYGEVCEALIDDEQGEQDLRAELVQVAAVAIAWVEQIDAVAAIRRRHNIAQSEWLTTEETFDARALIRMRDDILGNGSKTSD